MYRALAWLIAVLLVAGCASTSSPAPSVGAASQTPSMASTVSVADAAVLRDDGAIIIDVREPDEWAAGHIPGAILIPLGELPSRIGDVPPNRPIVVVCRSGNRSAQGRDILIGAGFPAVTSLDGGMNDWAGAGLPIETGE
ncbi:MAG TPA: rhodanese-like domain-containing protein [Candidatus Limnocylindrales bacterium]|nr:rhodanese-like domain-containing protein [Candidatus Limnocylindrales bacterium]